MPVSQASPQACPTGRESGFSLVELMIALGIGTILLALAFPDFMQSRANDKIRSAAAQLQQDMQWARAEAIKRNQKVTVATTVGATATTPCNWSLSTADASGNPQVIRQTTGARFAQQFSNVSCAANQSSITFTSLGWVAPGVTYTFAYNDPNTTKRQWQVVVGTGGRIVSRIVPGT